MMDVSLATESRTLFSEDSTKRQHPPKTGMGLAESCKTHRVGEAAFRKKPNQAVSSSPGASCIPSRPASRASLSRPRLDIDGNEWGNHGSNPRFDFPPWSSESEWSSNSRFLIAPAPSRIISECCRRRAFVETLVLADSMLPPRRASRPVVRADDDMMTGKGTIPPVPLAQELREFRPESKQGRRQANSIHISSAHQCSQMLA